MRTRRVWVSALLLWLGLGVEGCGAIEDAGEEFEAPFEETSSSVTDLAGAKSTLQTVVIPNLEGSTGYAYAGGDNLARMSIVRRSLTIAIDLLSLPTPQPGRAASVLRTAAIPMLETSPGFQKVRADNPNTFASTKMGKARTAIDVTITKLTGFTGSTTGTWTVYPVDVAGAKKKLTAVVIPNLLASSAYGFDEGDNLQRMSIVRRELEIARDMLSLPVPDPARARAVLKMPAIPVLVESPGYKKVLAGNPNTFWSTKLGIARKGIDFTVDKLTASPVIFQKAGVFIVNGNQWSPGAKGALLKQNGYGWVAIKIHHGTVKEGDQYLMQGLVDGYHAHGIAVGGWGYLTTDPAADAEVAAQQIQTWGLDFYLADAEAEYKYTSQSGAPDPVAYGRSQLFVNAFRQRLPGFPAAVSTFGAASHIEHLVDIDYAAWRNTGFDLMQQVYWNDYDIYRPSRCIRAALNDGWPIQKIHPTFGIWGGGVSRIVTPQEYLADVQGTGIYGFSTFIGDQMTDAEVVELGAGIGAGFAR